MSDKSRWEKTPSEVLDFKFDWSLWLNNDSISSSSWTVSSGITKNSDTNDNTTTTILLSAGTAGKVYSVKNIIVTTNGLTGERYRKIYVVDVKTN